MGFFSFLGVIVLLVLAYGLMIWVVMFLWNFVFGKLLQLGFWQAAALVLLVVIFGGYFVKK